VPRKDSPEFVKDTGIIEADARFTVNFTPWSPMASRIAPRMASTRLGSRSRPPPAHLRIDTGAGRPRFRSRRDRVVLKFLRRAHERRDVIADELGRWPAGRSGSR